MQIWNRVFLMDRVRQDEAFGPLVEIRGYINSVSDYGYNLWAAVIGAQNAVRFGSPVKSQSNVMRRLV